MGYSDYYEVLGVSRDATKQEIQKAYRGLAKRFHPDVSKEANAEGRFKEIGEAYEVLKDPDKRRLYDKWGPHWRAISEGRQPPPGPGSSEVGFDFGPFGVGGNINDLSSIFETVFRSQAQGGRGRRRPRPPRRPEQETTIDIPVTAAYQGGKRQIEFMDPASRAKRKLTVTVPAGVRDGQRIRLSGQGTAGADLYLRVRVGSDELFRLTRDDVRTVLRIRPDEAVLGTEAPLATLDGKVKVRVPPGSSTGRSIRLKGRGYPGRGGQRGDLYAEIQVVVPPEATDEERALYEQLRNVSKFDPRSGS